MPPSAVVFDCGFANTRIGLAHDAAPTVFPTQKGTKLYSCDHLERNYQSGLEQLKVTPEDHPALLTKPYFPCTKATSEKIAQIMFEDFKIPALHLIYPSVLSLYSYGSLTGLVVQSGYCESQFYPIYEGHLLERTITRGLPVAGQYLTEFLQNVLTKKGFRCDYATANRIKEKAFYVSVDLSNEQVNEEEFLLPDGSKVTLGNEKFLIPEELYKSSIEYSPLHEFIFHTLGRNDPELRLLLAEKIVLAGGTTLLPGFGERLERELIKGAPQFKFMLGGAPRVASQANRGDSAWLGGAVVAQLSTFSSMCMSRDEYEEYGPSLVHTKFF